MGATAHLIFPFAIPELFSFPLSLCLFLSMYINVAFIKLFDMQMTKSAYLKTTRGRLSTRLFALISLWWFWWRNWDIMILSSWHVIFIILACCLRN